MLERQRLQYLSVLGVESYASRNILPGAAASVALDDEFLFPPEVTVDTESTQLAQVDSINSGSSEVEAYNGGEQDEYSQYMASEQGVDSPTALTNEVAKQEQPSLADKLEVGKPEVSRSETTHSSSASTNPQFAIKFVLSVWRVEDCLIIDSRQPGSALPVDRLLQNILRAIGYPVAQLPASEVIRWPLFTSPVPIAPEEDAAQAQATVQAFISGQESRQSFSRLVLMGKDAAIFGLEGNHDYSSICGTLLESSERNAQVVVTPSLVDLLQNPLEKAVAWKALRQIIRQ